MRILSPSLAALCLVAGLLPTAQAQSIRGTVSVRFDCYLVSGSVGCRDLQDSYFSTLPYLNRTGLDEKTDLVLTVRSFPVERGTRYLISFRGGETHPKVDMSPLVLDTTSSSGALEQLTGHLVKGTAPYLEILEPSSTENGRTVIVVGDPNGAAPEEPGKSTTPWYFSAGGSGSYRGGDSESLSGSAGLSTNYSTEDWRFKADVDAEYEKIVVEFNGQTEIQTTTELRGTIVVVRSLDKHWNFGVVASAAYSPDNLNLDSMITGGVGIEFNLVPFIKTNDRSFAIRYVASWVHQNYQAPNLLQLEQDAFLEHSLTAYVNWHFSRVDLSLGTSATTNDWDSRFSTVGGRSSATFRLTNAVSLHTGIHASYRRAVRSQPFDEDVQSSLEKYLGGYYARWSKGAYLSISYSIGNSGLNSRDTRWK